jgi:hypothetical protein
MITVRTLLGTLTLCVAVAALFTISLARPGNLDGSERIARRLINAVPPVGIGAGQTLHITFLNTGDNPLEIIPCIFDSHGEELKEGTSMSLAPGQMASFDVAWNELGARGERHLQLRAVAHIDAQDIKHLVVAGEVLDDDSGRTSLYVPGVRAGFDPQPDPPTLLPN